MGDARDAAKKKSAKGSKAPAAKPVDEAKWSVSQIASRLACSCFYAAEAARKCGDARFSQFSMSCRVNFHANGFGVRLLNSSYNANRTRIASSFAKSFGVNTFLWMIEK